MSEEQSEVEKFSSVQSDNNEEEDEEEDEEEEEEEHPEITAAKERLLREEAYAVGLDAVKYCRNEGAECGKINTLNSRLNLKVSTWMELYENLDEPDEFMLMRDVSIGIMEKLHEFQIETSSLNSFAEKYKAAAPYHFFLTKVRDEPMTHEQPYSISFHEIIDCSLGELVDSFHITPSIEVSWLVIEYMIACQKPKMSVIHESCEDPDNIHIVPFDIELEAGVHIHSNISLLKYKGDKIRIIISTANLNALDWHIRTQGLWISPFLPLLPVDADDNDGESPTNFKRNFIEYLSQHKEPQVFGWLCLMHRTDFSAVKVFFVASVPGNYRDRKLNSWGLNKLGKILSEHAVLPENAKDWPIVAQCPTIDSFGSEYTTWLRDHLQVMTFHKNNNSTFIPYLKFIFPSKENYLGSYDYEFHNNCLSYNEEVHSQQKWIREYLHQWKAEKTCRTFAMPNSKCYLRISPDCTEISWFFLTSANFDKVSMGTVECNQLETQFVIKNYEAGVVFMPKILIDRDSFPISEAINSDSPLFIIPFDVPLTPYRPRDEPYFTQVPGSEVIEKPSEEE